MYCVIYYLKHAFWFDFKGIETGILVLGTIYIIGLLIALSINNWNEDMKAWEIENQKGNSLAMDFNLNLFFETLKRKIC